MPRPADSGAELPLALPVIESAVRRLAAGCCSGVEFLMHSFLSQSLILLVFCDKSLIHAATELPLNGRYLRSVSLSERIQHDRVSNTPFPMTRNVRLLTLPKNREHLRLRGGSTSNDSSHEVKLPTSWFTNVIAACKHCIRILCWYLDQLFVFQERRLNVAAKVLNRKLEVCHPGFTKEKDHEDFNTPNTAVIPEPRTSNQTVEINSYLTTLPRKSSHMSAFSLKILNASIKKVSYTS